MPIRISTFALSAFLMLMPVYADDRLPLEGLSSVWHETVVCEFVVSLMSFEPGSVSVQSTDIHDTDNERVVSYRIEANNENGQRNEHTALCRFELKSELTGYQMTEVRVADQHFVGDDMISIWNMVKAILNSHPSSDL